MTKASLCILIAGLILVVIPNALADDLSKLSLSELDQRCEEARETKLAPLREAEIEQCKAEKRSDPAYCESFFKDFGDAKDANHPFDNSDTLGYCHVWPNSMGNDNAPIADFPPVEIYLLESGATAGWFKDPTPDADTEHRRNPGDQRRSFRGNGRIQDEEPVCGRQQIYA